MARTKQEKTPPTPPPPQSLREAAQKAHTANRQSSYVEGGNAVFNLEQLGTVAVSAAVTAEVNHTRTNRWSWRFAEFASSLPVLAFTGSNHLLGRVAIGVFAGALVETLVDRQATTGWEVLPPDDSRVYVVE